MNLEVLKETLGRAKKEINKVIIGQESVVESALVVVATGQHALVEGVPGIAKTLLVRTLARVLGVEFSRIQFTPDLMPADILGATVFRQGSGDFEFHPGPVFTSFLLADEINRAPAKTQSALLQAMQERRVTVDRTTYELPTHFSVFATQNPVEFEGTYALPEAQKDRFLLKIKMGYPEESDELELARQTVQGESPEDRLESGSVGSVLDAGGLSGLKATLKQVEIRAEVQNYLVQLVRASRSHPSILVGAGPRATQAMVLAGRAMAALRGNDYVTPDDVRSLARPILEHRLVLRPEYEIEGLEAGEIVDQLVKQIPVPR
jgi:MoxR-like ATPase